MVDIADVVTYTNFGDYRLSGFWVAGGQISPSPIDFHRRPYNTLALPCERVMCMWALAFCWSPKFIFCPYAARCFSIQFKTTCKDPATNFKDHTPMRSCIISHHTVMTRHVWQLFKVKRSKVKVTRSRDVSAYKNAVTRQRINQSIKVFL